MSRLPGILAVLAEEVGEERALALGRRLAGDAFPALEQLDRLERDARIRRDFNGGNINDLTQRYGLSRRHLYRILFPSPPK